MSKSDYFVMAEDAGQLKGVFEGVAARVEALAKSNYVVGVCTPIELGSPTLTIQIDVDGAEATRTVPYATPNLTGDVASCDPDTIANRCRGDDTRRSLGKAVSFPVPCWIVRNPHSASMRR